MKLTFPVTRSADPGRLPPAAVPVTTGSSTSGPSKPAHNVKLLERQDQASSAMLRSLLSRSPPASVAGGGSYRGSNQATAAVREEVLFSDSTSRDFGGDNATDWTGLAPINAFRANASRVNDELPDYITFYAQDAVRPEGGLVDSKFPYKNGTVSTPVGTFASPYEFATGLRNAIVQLCGSQVSKGVGTPTYDPAVSYGVEIIAFDSNTAVGIAGPNPNSSIGLNTILTGCVRLAYESAIALPPGNEENEAGGKKSGKQFGTVEWIGTALGIATFLSILYCWAKAKPGAANQPLKCLKSCFEKRPVQDFDGKDDRKELRNTRLTEVGPATGAAPFIVREPSGSVHEVDGVPGGQAPDVVQENEAHHLPQYIPNSVDNDERPNRPQHDVDNLPVAQDQDSDVDL